MPAWAPLPPWLGSPVHPKYPILEMLMQQKSWLDHAVRLSSFIAILALMGRTWLVFELAQVGFFFAAFLSYIEAFILEKWCIYCVRSQAIIAAIFLLSAVALLLERRQRRTASTGAAASAPVE